MTDIGSGDNRFDFGRVVGRTFSLIGKNFILFLLLAIIFVGIPQFALYYGQAYVAQNRPELAGYTTFGGSLVSLITTYILQGSLTRAAVDDLSGRGVRIGAALSDGLGFFFPLFVVGLLVGLGTMIGLVLLVVPGLLLAVRWVVSAPAVVMERDGPTKSMARSADLTEGHRWAIFGLLLLYLVVFYAITFGIGIALASVGIAYTERLMSGIPLLIYGGVQALTSAIVTLVSTVGTAVLYFELRHVKEGVGVEDLAKVFD